MNRLIGTLVFCVAIIVTGCSAGSSGGSTAASSPSASPRPTPLSSTPSVPTPSGSPDSSGSGAAPGAPGIGGLAPRRVVTPKPGQLGVHPIPAESFSADVHGRKVELEIGYSIGVEPCYILDSIDVTRHDHTFTITLRQGHGPGNAVCIQIAELVRSFVDLGELAPGTYKITDSQKGAPPISVTVV